MRLLFGLAALLAANAAQAADIKLISAERGDYPAVISFNGVILSTDPSHFAEVVAASNLRDGHVVVFLTGPGGLIATSIDIGMFIRQHKFDTAVPDEKYCFSACALAWLGGVWRYLGEDSRVGFHSAVDRFPDGRQQRSTYGNKRVAGYLFGLGYPKGLADYVNAADPGYITFLSGYYADRLHIYPHPLSEIGQPPSPVAVTLEWKGFPWEPEPPVRCVWPPCSETLQAHP